MTGERSPGPALRSARPGSQNRPGQFSGRLVPPPQAHRLGNLPGHAHWARTAVRTRHRHFDDQPDPPRKAAPALPLGPCHCRAPEGMACHTRHHQPRTRARPRRGLQPPADVYVPRPRDTRDPDQPSRRSAHRRKRGILSCPQPGYPRQTARPADASARLELSGDFLLRPGVQLLGHANPQRRPSPPSSAPRRARRDLRRCSSPACRRRPPPAPPSTPPRRPARPARR